MTLTLSDTTPIAKGGERFVFIHPDNPDWLIKVWHERFHKKQEKRVPIVIKFLRLKRYWSLLNELTEYLAIRECAKPNLNHIQQIVGLVDTDLGLGMIVKAVKKENGELAPTTEDLVKNAQYTAEHDKALDEYFDWMRDTDIIIRDFNLNNLVWDELAKKFVLIDGIGSKPGFSLRSFSKAYNKKANFNRIQKFKTRMKKALS
ncbi:YrbL family protein [Litoribacillus peritrichatus]|uniref:PhoP regulatory network YrbL family protein n=1 Tax=Litoribacillus peritrichatus TaxID=718191 RepID=A0ABP7MNT9_9GAMM